MTVRSLVVGLLLIYAAPALAQTERSADVQISVGTSPLRRYQPEAWAVVAITAVNPSDEDAEGFVVVYGRGDQQTQYARQMWLPARSQRTCWLPLRVPDLNRWEEYFNVEYIQLVGDSSEDRIKQRSGNSFRASAQMRLDAKRVKTAHMFGRADTAPRDHPDYEAFEAVRGARFDLDEFRATSELEDDFLPPFAAAFDGMDQIVIGSDRLLDDSAGLAKLRHWLAGGGRMWIMLDRVSPELVTALLGDTFTYEEIDRLPLTEYLIENLYAAEDEEQLEPWRSEEPVELMRVLTDATDVHCRVDGWPAAFWQPFGRGEVLFTTLGARGWRYHYHPFAIPRGDRMPTDGITNALRSVTRRVYQRRTDTMVEVADVRQELQDQIGYEVPSQGTAGTILSLNCLSLLVVGLVLAKMRRLDHLAWLFPLLMVVVAVVFIVLGINTKDRVKPSAVEWQLVQVTPGTDEAHVSSLAAVYSPAEIELPLSTGDAGITTPELGDLAGISKRAVWTDDGRGAWQQSIIAPGTVRFSRLDDVVALPEQARASGRFGANGFEGRLEGVDVATGDADAIISSPPSRPIAVTWTGGGHFVCNTRSVLDTGQYLRALSLSDEQRRRQQVYGRLLDDTDDLHYPKQPTLFFWREPLATSVEFPDGFQQSGKALVAVPLDIRPTPPGESFTVPSSFIQIGAAQGDQGVSAAYNQRTGRWITEATKPTTSTLSFRLPPQVLPCDLTKANLTIRLSAPSRIFKVTAMRGETEHLIGQRESPLDVYNFTVTDPEILQLGADADLTFTISISEPTTPMTAAEQPVARPGFKDPDSSAKRQVDSRSWQIDYLHLEVSGDKK